MLDLCREFGHPPSWWRTLSREDKALMIGWYRHRVWKERTK